MPLPPASVRVAVARTTSPRHSARMCTVASMLGFGVTVTIRFALFVLLTDLVCPIAWVYTMGRTQSALNRGRSHLGKDYLDVMSP